MPDRVEKEVAETRAQVDAEILADVIDQLEDIDTDLAEHLRDEFVGSDGELG